jgi:hypothetical protein
MEIITIIRYCSGETHISNCPAKLKEAFEAGKNLI